jgi:hypothetical protein
VLDRLHRQGMRTYVIALVSLAAEHSAFVRLDMENSAVVDEAPAIYGALRSEGLDHTGVVLQAGAYDMPAA